MALGGGTFVTQNKVLPGAYFQFISLATASATIANRGTAGIGLELDWGTDGEIFTVESGDFQKNSMEIFGYSYADEKLKGIRDLFKHAKTLHAYKLTSGGVKASNTYATAKCSGVRGNELKVVIQDNVDNEDAFDVSLYLGTTKVDVQTVTAASELVGNAFVDWKTSATLAVNAGTPLTGGTNGTVDSSAHQEFLDKLESYPDTNAVGYAGTDDATKGLYIAWADRLRSDVGIRLQAVVFDKAGDSISCVNVKNSADLVYWATGVIAGTAVNKSATNMTYDGETTISTDYTQKQLEAAILAGEWTLHQVGTEIHVLEDINSFISVTDDMGEVFNDNQTIRTIDTIADSTASVFASKYMGKVPNNASGRVSLWSDIVAIYKQLYDIGAVESYDADEITVSQGDAKKSVLTEGAFTVANTMTKLYLKSVVA